MDNADIIMSGIYLLFVIGQSILFMLRIRRERRISSQLRERLYLSTRRYNDWRKQMSYIMDGAFPEPLIEALLAVYEERRRQDKNWGDQSGNSLFEWMSILGEEYGELCEAVNETCFISEHAKRERGGREAVRREAVQVAAVAVAIVEAAAWIPAADDTDGKEIQNGASETV